LCCQQGGAPILARLGDFGETYRQSLIAWPDVGETPHKTIFYDANHKIGRPAGLVTLVTDLIAARRKTSNGNLRSSLAVNCFVRSAFAGAWVRRKP
jgi:hypothetical protein